VVAGGATVGLAVGLAPDDRRPFGLTAAGACPGAVGTVCASDRSRGSTVARAGVEVTPRQGDCFWLGADGAEENDGAIGRTEPRLDVDVDVEREAPPAEECWPPEP
jgi:hypothetical protein